MMYHGYIENGVHRKHGSSTETRNFFTVHYKGETFKAYFSIFIFL